ncbi:PQQ-binding-like beta-propeller repeat protein [Planctomycetales bacterium ZRK34]|nr:PQQ-binding-like beta-propeller repeat protein [Planctomycetales bacterium ZRK34]
MNKTWWLCAVVCLSGSVLAAEPGMVASVVATETHVIRFDESGNQVWQTPSGVSRDVWALPDGHTLFAFNFEPGVTGGVREVDASGKVVWEFKTDGWVLSCQRLADGNTLVGAAGRCAVLIVDPAGRIVNEIKVKMRKPHKHALTTARMLDNSHVLVVEEQVGLVREYQTDGQVVWEYHPPFRPFGAVRVAGGNTFISGRDGIIEVTPNRAIVWRLTREDVSAMGPRWFAGFQIRANGNLVICNPGGKVPFYEVDRNKQIVWQSTLSRDAISPAHNLCLVNEKPPLKH